MKYCTVVVMLCPGSRGILPLFYSKRSHLDQILKETFYSRSTNPDHQIQMTGGNRACQTGVKMAESIASGNGRITQIYF
jgi:hypothetical protein